MKRDIQNITRYLNEKENSDIIYKKSILYKTFNDDPDLLEVLGHLDSKPLNKFQDKDNPTEEEKALREEILLYNERITHDRIVPFLKLNDVQTEVVNYICFDIQDIETLRYQKALKTQQLWVMCMVYEDDILTEYVTNDGMKIPRTDLLSYIVKDLLAGSNVLGMQLILESDRTDIVDMRYYVRTLKFNMTDANSVHYGGVNSYDDFQF